MQIRRAEIKDIEKIDEMLVQVNLLHHNGRPDIFKPNQKKYSDEQLKALFQDDDKPIFVATDDNDVALGYVFCIIQQHKNDSILTDIKTLYIDDLCVDEHRRGEKIGKLLLNFAFEYAKKIGCYNVTLNAWCLNQNALNFYTANGMNPMKVYMEKILD
ncbi:MAG: GNAT family N-acetyltransferase [Clostridiales bacterium]|nr:GNAT family N-acetyltransferase [Clostridiales bacterium]